LVLSEDGFTFSKAINEIKSLFDKMLDEVLQKKLKFVDAEEVNDPDIKLSDTDKKNLQEVLPENFKSKKFDSPSDMMIHG